MFKTKEPLPEQKIINTPYGGRLEYTLPKGNVLTVHLKDKKKIRHKKRWSQVLFIAAKTDMDNMFSIIKKEFHQSYLLTDHVSLLHSWVETKRKILQNV